MSWLPGHANDSAEAILGLRPAAAERVRELEAALYDDDRLDPTIVRLVHDRVNLLLGIDGVSFASATRICRHASERLSRSQSNT